MSQDEAEKRIEEFLKEEPELSRIPASTPMEKLRVRHGGYDVTGPKTDHNVAFPLKRLKSLEKKGTIGKLAGFAYSFVGACMTGVPYVRGTCSAVIRRGGHSDRHHRGESF